MKRTAILALVVLALVTAPIAGASGTALVTGTSPAAQTSDALPEYESLPQDQVGEAIPDTLNTRLPVNDSALVERTRSDTHSTRSAATMNATWQVVNRRSGQIVDQNAADAIVQGSDDVPLAYALVLNDTVAHEGRQVAVPAAVLNDTVGYRPVKAYGKHSSGDRWNATIDYQDGYAVWTVPKFSENTITWSSEVSITATPASDGSNFEYNLTDVDSVSNYTINVTGSTNHEWDNETGNYSANGSPSVSPAGNLDPVHPGTSANAYLNVTGHQRDTGESIHAGPGGGDDMYHPDPPETIDDLLGRKTDTHSSGSVDYDIYIADGNTTGDSNFTEGTKVCSGSTGYDGTWYDMSCNANYDANTTQGATIQVSMGTAYDPEVDIQQVISGYPSSVTASTNVDSRSLGNVGSGSADTPINIAENTSSLDFSATEGNLSYTIEFKERTQTVDPAVTVNGNTTGGSSVGALSDGTTTSLSTNTSWVGTSNTVSIGVGDGTLSADAPTSQADLDYSHDASDARDVTYKAEQWSERYNTSRTFSSDQNDAQIRIPFVKQVHDIRKIETQVNGGGWSEPSSLTYDTYGNDLVVEFGSVQAGDTIAVRTTGSRVFVRNGSVEVYDPTLPGGELDSDIRFNSWDGSDSHILVGDTTHGERVHFAYETAWTNAEDHVIIKANGEQRLKLPKASKGDEARIQTIPVSASPATGDVRIDVENPKDNEPEFVVSPGNVSEDSVDYTYITAKHEEDYELYSKTNDVTRDFGTASSPITLTDDDSAETLIFRLDDGSGTSDGSGGGGGGGAAIPLTGGSGTGSGLGQLPILAGGALAVLTAAILIRRRVGTWRENRAATSSGSSGGVVAKLMGLLADVLVAFSDAVFRIGGAVRSALGTRPGKLALASVVVISLFAFDIITFTEQERTILLGVTVLLGAFVGLRRFDQFSWPLYSVVAAATVIFTLSAMGTDLIGQLINSPMFPIVGIGGLYLGYKALESWREGQKTVVQVEGQTGE